MSSEKMATEFEKEKLIELVQFYPIIFDSSRADFKDRTLKENAWRDIADRLFQRETDAGGKSMCNDNSFLAVVLDLNNIYQIVQFNRGIICNNTLIQFMLTSESRLIS